MPLTGADCVEIFFAERSCQFYSYDTTDRDSVTRWHHLQRQLDRAANTLSSNNNNNSSSAGEGVGVGEGSNGLSSSSAASAPETPQQRHLSSTLQSVLPLPPADCVTTLSAKEAHFYRFISSCTDTSVVFDVCVEDPSTGQRKK